MDDLSSPSSSPTCEPGIKSFSREQEFADAGHPCDVPAVVVDRLDRDPAVTGRILDGQVFRFTLHRYGLGDCRDESQDTFELIRRNVWDGIVSWRDRDGIHRRWHAGGVRSDSRFPTGSS